MKKYILLTICIAALSFKSYSQILDYNQSDNKRVVFNGIKYNWFVSTYGGINIHDGDLSRVGESAADRVGPGGKLSVGKWLTSGVAIRLSYSAYHTKRGGVESTLAENQNKNYFKHNSNYGNVTGDVMFDLINMIAGYNFNRVYSVMPYAGIGFAEAWQSDNTTDLTTNLGIMNKFKINRSLDINLDLTSSVIFSNYNSDKSGLGKYNSLYGINIGITYNIGAKEMKNVKDLKKRYNQTVLAEKRRLMLICADAEAALEQEKYFNSMLENSYASRNVNLEELTGFYDEETENESEKIFVFFDLGKSSFEEKYNIILKNYADIIKTSPATSSFKIIGYADLQADNEEYNYNKSVERVNNVKSCRVNEYQVEENRIIIEAKGNKDMLFSGDTELNRVVIIERFEQKTVEEK